MQRQTVERRAGADVINCPISELTKLSGKVNGPRGCVGWRTPTHIPPLLAPARLIALINELN